MPGRLVAGLDAQSAYPCSVEAPLAGYLAAMCAWRGLYSADCYPAEMSWFALIEPEVFPEFAGLAVGLDAELAWCAACSRPIFRRK